MPKSGKVAVTADEIIASLSRSTLPTVIVEGGDDMIVFRKLEEVLERFAVDVLAAEGRNTLLELFDRRGEIRKSEATVFVADKDKWVYASIPAQYVAEELVFTDGYSIENDVFRDGNLFGYMDAAERASFGQELPKVIDCYALGLSRILDNREGKIAIHPNEILEDATQCVHLMRLAHGEEYPSQLRDQIFGNFAKLLRGKTLMGLLMRQLSRAGRVPRHNGQAFLEIVGTNRGPLLNRLFQQVEHVFL